MNTSKRNIIVGFSRNKGLLSKLICWWTHSPISHTYIKVDLPQFASQLVYHAHTLNVHYLNYEHFCKKNTVVAEYVVEVSEEQYVKSSQWRFQQLGKSYGILTLLGYLLIMLGVTKRNALADGDYSHICVELVARTLGIPAAETLTPAQLHEIVKHRGVLLKNG